MGGVFYTTWLQTFVSYVLIILVGLLIISDNGLGTELQCMLDYVTRRPFHFTLLRAIRVDMSLLFTVLALVITCYTDDAITAFLGFWSPRTKKPYSSVGPSVCLSVCPVSEPIYSWTIDMIDWYFFRFRFFPLIRSYCNFARIYI